MPSFYATTTGASAKTGGDWANAFSLVELLAWMGTTANAGDVVFIMQGTYTLIANLTLYNTRNGTSNAYIFMIGVKTGTTAEPPTTSDWAYGTDRPLFSCGSYTFRNEQQMWGIKNLRWTGNCNGSQFQLGEKSQSFNCDGVNIVGTAGRAAFYIRSSGLIDYCTFSSTNGIGFLQPYQNFHVFNSFFKGGTVGLSGNYAGVTVLGCVFSGQSTAGIYVGVTENQFLFTALNNDFYSCGVGIDLNVSGNFIIKNNNFVSNTTGISSDNANNAGIIDYNNFYLNGTTVSNVSLGPNTMAINPEYTNAAGDDFSIESTSLIDTGIGNILAGTGYNIPGAVNPSGASSGGGSQIGAFENGAWR